MNIDEREELTALLKSHRRIAPSGVSWKKRLDPDASLYTSAPPAGRYRSSR